MSKIKSFKLKKGSWFRSDMAEYHVDGVLGRGWEGEVYSVREGYTDGRRALKIFDSSDGLEEELFSNYAYKLEQLTQARVPGVLMFYHAGYYEKLDSWFIITEYINGVELKAFENQLSVFQSLKITNQLLETLVKAHAIGQTFGDLHAENILYSKKNQTTTIIDIDFESEFTLEYIQDDIAAVCQIFFDLCKEIVPADLKKILSVDNAERFSASEILDELNKLY